MALTRITGRGGHVSVEVDSRFPAAKRGGWDAVEAALDAALKAGAEKAESSLRETNTRRGYALPVEVNTQRVGHREGRIFVPSKNWFLRFFEYGTVYIAAAPFLRPAARRVVTVFSETLDDDFEKHVARRTRFTRSK